MIRERFLVYSINAMLIGLIIANIKIGDTSISTYISVIVLSLSVIVFFPERLKIDSLLRVVLVLILVLSFFMALWSYFWFSELGFDFSSFYKNALLFYLYLFYFLFVGFFSKENPAIASKSYREIGKFMYLTLQINSVFVIVQFILFRLFGYNLTFPWSISSGLFSSFRPPGFFSEPSHFAEYFLIYVFVFGKEFDLKDLLILTALSVSSSMLGFISIFVFIVYSALFGIKRKQEMILLIFSFVAFSMVNLLFNPDIRFRVNLISDNSFKLRFLKFFYVFSSLSTKKILIGFGFAQSGLAINYYNGPYESLFKLLPGYFSGIGNNLLMIGAICSVIIECFLFYYFLRTKGIIKGLFFAFIFLGMRLIADINFTISMFWLPLYLILMNYYSLCFVGEKNEQNN